jgi:hypothetical protein
VSDLAWNEYRAGRHADAEKLSAGNLSATRKRCGDRSEQTALALNQLATTQLAQRKTGADIESALKEAQSILRPAFSLAPPPSALADVQLNFSALYRLRGRPTEAAEYAGAVRATNADRLYSVAREFAWCSSDVIRLHPNPTPAQSVESRRYADESVKSLRQAMSHGFRNAGLLRSEGAFAPLRERDDFKQLLAEMEKPRP